MENKTCKLCNKTKPLKYFYKGHAKCKQCDKAYARKKKEDEVKFIYDIIKDMV